MNLDLEMDLARQNSGDKIERSRERERERKVERKRKRLGKKWR